MTAPTLERVPTRPGPDFERLWLATAVSQAGSAVGYGALPLVAVLTLHVSAFQVSLLAALSGIASALLVVRLGPAVEFRRKRPTMMTADLARAATLGSVPITAALGMLTYAQLCVVGVVATTCDLAFTAASGAHLKALVADRARLAATSRLETTNWSVNSAGPLLGGALVSWLGPTTTVLVDALSYVASALGIRSLRAPEPPPPPRQPAHWLTDVTAGWRTILTHPGLRALWWNSLVFGACIIGTSPLLTVFMLRDLGLGAWAYGVAMGVPCLGGVLGALCASRLARRLGELRVLLASGVLRTVWLVLLALAPNGLRGLVVITAAETGLLCSAGIFNPTFAAYRLRATPDDRLARVTAAWSVSAKITQPIGILTAGALAALAGPRTAIAVAGGVLLLSGLLLPRRQLADRRP